VNVAKTRVQPSAFHNAALITWPALPDWVITVTQVSRSVAVATTFPVSPDRPET
jgi:hypothetical protein